MTLVPLEAITGVAIVIHLDPETSASTAKEIAEAKRKHPSGGGLKIWDSEVGDATDPGPREYELEWSVGSGRRGRTQGGSYGRLTSQHLGPHR